MFPYFRQFTSQSNGGTGSLAFLFKKKNTRDATHGHRIFKGFKLSRPSYYYSMIRLIDDVHITNAKFEKGQTQNKNNDHKLLGVLLGFVL